MKKIRGSITVEASIVVPIVLFSILALVYLGTLLYRQASMQSLAEHTAEYGARSWTNSSRNIATGWIPGEYPGDQGLYWRLLDTQSAEKKHKIIGYAGSCLETGSIFLAEKEESDIQVQLEERLLYKLLTVRFQEDYDIPLAGFLKIFGLNPQITLTAQASAVVDEPAEFIRNTDFAIDTGRRLEAENPGMGKAAGVVRGVFSKISRFINKLMEQGT